MWEMWMGDFFLSVVSLPSPSVSITHLNISNPTRCTRREKARQEKGSMCTNELVLFVVQFRAWDVSSSLFERACRSCLVSSLSLYQTLGREGPSHSVLSKPWSCLRDRASVWIEAPSYVQKVACSALITSLSGNLPTYKVLIKPCWNGCGWQVYETTVVGINSLITIMHHQQIQLSECMKDILFARVQHSFTVWDFIL